MQPAALQYPVAVKNHRVLQKQSHNHWQENHGVTMASKREWAGCWSPTASTRWHHITFSPLHFLVNEVPLPTPSWLEGMNHRGKADPAHPSSSPCEVSPSPAHGAASLQLAQMGLPHPSHRMPATYPGKSLCWIPVMAMRSLTKLKTDRI